jgi:hypothetical protein
MQRIPCVILALGACVVSTAPPRRVGGPPPPAEPAPQPTPQPPPVPQQATLTGVVTDRATGKPIDKASIDVNSPVLTRNLTVQTGPDGRYTTDPVPPGDFVVRVRRSGYEPFEQRLRVGGATATLDVALVPLRR